MADALTKAPSKKEKKEVTVDGQVVVEGSNEHLVLLQAQEYDVAKKYMFELAEQVSEREQPVVDVDTKRATQHKPFKPYQNMVLTSQIVWKGQRRTIRYYDGCTSLFVDEQPKDKDTIEQLIKQTNRDKYVFIDGKFGVYGDDRLFLLYANICSWNTESPFRTRTASGVFFPVNADKKATEEMNLLDLTEKALQYAKDAPEKKMRIHADFLGIATVDFDSGNELSEKEIRTEYRKKALKAPQAFIDGYGNRSLETQFFVKEALQKGLITNKNNPNAAAWASGSVICDISGLKSQEAIAQRLFEFSQTMEGEEFLIQLQSISE